MEKPIYNAFVEFVKATFNRTPEELSEQQHEQLKMAFYGGALTVQSIYIDGVVSRDQQLIESIMTGIQQELIEYGQEFNFKNG